MTLPNFRLLATAVLLSVAHAPCLAAQSTARDSVVAIVNEFFRAIASSDSSAASGTVLPQGVMVSTQSRGDSVTSRVQPLSAFPAMLARNQRKMAERMWEPTVHVHGSIAVVWAQYDFHVDGVFSHCGVDAFTLAKLERTWRIVSVAYTVERTGCKPSPLGPIK